MITHFIAIVQAIVYAITRFPYLTIPFIIIVVILFRWIGTKLSLSTELAWLFTAICSPVIVAIVVTPLLAAHNGHRWNEFQKKAQEEKVFWEQLSVSPTNAIEIVATLPNVAEEIEKTRLQNYQKCESSDIWNEIPLNIPPDKEGYPMLQYSTTRGATLSYTVHVHMLDDTLSVYEVDAHTGTVTNIDNVSPAE